MPGIVQNQDHEQWIQSVAKALNISIAAELEEAEPEVSPFPEDFGIEDAGAGPLPPKLQKLNDLGQYRKRLNALQASSRASFKRKAMLEDASELTTFEAAHSDVTGSMNVASKLLKSFDKGNGMEVSEIEDALQSGENALDRMQRAYNEGRDSILRMVKDTKEQAKGIASDLDAQVARQGTLNNWPIDLKACDSAQTETQASLSLLNKAIDKCDLPSALQSLQQAKAGYSKHEAALAKAQSARDALKAQLESKAARVERAASDASSSKSVLEGHPIQLDLFEVLRNQVVTSAAKARSFIKQEQGSDAQSVLEGTDEALAAMTNVLAKVQTGDNDVSTSEGNPVEFKIMASDLAKVSTQADQLFQTRRSDVAQLGAGGANFQKTFDALQQTVQAGQNAVLSYDMSTAQKQLETAQGQLKEMGALSQAVTAAFATIADDIAQMRHQLTETVKARRKYNSYFKLAPDVAEAQNTFDDIYYDALPKVNEAETAFKQNRLADAQAATHTAQAAMIDLSLGLETLEDEMRGKQPARVMSLLDDLAFQVEASRQTLVTYQNKGDSFKDKQESTTFKELVDFALAKVQRARDIIDAKDERGGESSLVEVQLAVEAVGVALEQGAQTAKTFAEICTSIAQAKTDLAGLYDQRSTLENEDQLNDFLSYNTIALDLVFETESLLERGDIKDAQDALAELETAKQRLQDCLANKLDAEEHDSVEEAEAPQNGAGDNKQDKLIAELTEACKKLKLAIHTSHKQWRPSCLEDQAEYLEAAFIAGIQHVERGLEAITKPDIEACKTEIVAAKQALSQMQHCFSVSQKVLDSEIKNLNNSATFYKNSFEDLYAKKADFRDWPIEFLKIDSVYDAAKEALTDLAKAIEKADLKEAKAVEGCFKGLQEALESAMEDGEDQVASLRTDLILSLSNHQSELGQLFARSSNLMGQDDILDKFLALYDDAQAEVEEAQYQIKDENGKEATKALKKIEKLLKDLEKTLNQAAPQEEPDEVVLPDDEPEWLKDMAAFEAKKLELVAEANKILKQVEDGHKNWKPACEGIYAGLMEKFYKSAVKNINAVNNLKDETGGDLLKIIVTMNDHLTAAYQYRARMEDIHGVSRQLLQSKLKGLSEHVDRYQAIIGKVEAQAQSSIAWEVDLTAYKAAQENVTSVIDDLRKAISAEEAERGMDMISLIEQKIAQFAASMKALEVEQKQIKAELMTSVKILQSKLVQDKEIMTSLDGDQALAEQTLSHVDAAIKALDRVTALSAANEAVAAREAFELAQKECALADDVATKFLQSRQDNKKAEAERRLSALQSNLKDAEEHRAKLTAHSDGEFGDQRLARFEQACSVVQQSLKDAYDRLEEWKISYAHKLAHTGEEYLIKMQDEIKNVILDPGDERDLSDEERNEQLAFEIDKIQRNVDRFAQEQSMFRDNNERKIFVGHFEKARQFADKAQEHLKAGDENKALDQLENAQLGVDAMATFYKVGLATAQLVENYLKEISDKQKKHATLYKEHTLIQDRKEQAEFERNAQIGLSKLREAEFLIQSGKIKSGRSKPVAEALSVCAQELASMERLLRIQSDAKHKLKNLFRSRKKK